MRWWDGSRHRQGRFTGTVNKIVARKTVPHALIEERVVTEENGTITKTRIVHAEALRPSNDGRTVRSRGHYVYPNKEGSWSPTRPA